MKAYVLNGVNDLCYKEVAMPICPEGWAIVQVMASGICSSDIARVFTKGTYHFPTIPGHEFSGIVSEVGSEKDTSLIGKKVGIFPLIPCRQCDQCKQSKYEMCKNYDYVGSRRDGGFAEYVAVPVWNLIVLDERVSLISAAMLEPLSVALHAVKRSNLKSNDTVGIVGTGMIGIGAGQWAKNMGASFVSVIGRGEEKREMIEHCGLHYVSKFQDADEYDVVVEAVGSMESIAMSIELTKPGGTIVLMGNPHGDILLTQDVYWKILRRQLLLVGTWNSSFNGLCKSDWTEAANALSVNTINVSPLVTHILEQSELKKGLELMNLKKEPYCKIITIWNNYYENV